MRKPGKKHIDAQKKVQQAHVSKLEDALALVVDIARAKFDESVDAHIVLGIDPSKGEQAVRGSALLPYGTGKKIRVLVFAQGEYEEAARLAGADYVGLDDLMDKIEGGWFEFDAAVATPDIMGKIGRVAKLLGPRGLLPNKKIGTVTFDIKSIVMDLKSGRVSFRNDKGGTVHVPFGKVSFGAEKLKDNFLAFIKAVAASKPSSSKGKFFKKITISSTMGVGVEVSSEGIA